MAEYIEREALVKAISEIEVEGVFMASVKGSVMKIIFEQPAADIVAVVRCSNCKHWIKKTDLYGECSLIRGLNTTKQAYCNCGAKMDLE